MTLDQLISNIGGQLGVWAGMSILTVFQLLMYIISGVFTDSNEEKKEAQLRYKVQNADGIGL